WWSQVRHPLGCRVVHGMTVVLARGALEERALVIRVAGGDGIRRRDPDRHALTAARVQVARIAHRHARVGSVQRADVHVVQAAIRADEDLPQRPGLLLLVSARRHQATCPSTRAACFRAYSAAASRTHAPSSCAVRRRSSRSALQGPLPRSTSKNSSQSISPIAYSPVASSKRSSGSGSVMPRISACGTSIPTKRCRRSSFEKRLIFHFMDWAELGDWSSGGPNMARLGQYQRFTASWAISRWSSVPCMSVSRISNPCRWWKDSSLQTRTIARPYGPYEARHNGTWLTIAAPSTSQPIAPMSAHVGVG